MLAAGNGWLTGGGARRKETGNIPGVTIHFQGKPYRRCFPCSKFELSCSRRKGAQTPISGRSEREKPEREKDILSLSRGADQLRIREMVAGPQFPLGGEDVRVPPQYVPHAVLSPQGPSLRKGCVPF